MVLTHRVLSAWLVGMVVVAGLTVTAFAQTGTTGNPTDEDKAWTKVNGLDAASLEGFLKEFPNGQHTIEVTRAISLHKDLDKASALNTLSAYRGFLELFKSDSAETLLSAPLAPSSKLYWSAHEKVEKLIISQIDKGGIGRRFWLKDLAPQDDSYTGSITVLENGTSGMVTLRTLYPGDEMGGLLTSEGVSMGPPRGNRSVIRFIGKIAVGDGSIDGDGKEPLSFILLKPYGAVYLDGRGTVVTGGKSISLPISPSPTARKGEMARH